MIQKLDSIDFITFTKIKDMSNSYLEAEELKKDYERRFKNTQELIKNRDIKPDNYICKCGKINVFGGEGYVDWETKEFKCGYC